MSKVEQPHVGAVPDHAPVSADQSGIESNSRVLLKYLGGMALLFAPFVLLVDDAH